jgi:hypothetical protein
MAFDPDRLRKALLSASTPQECWERLCTHLAYGGLTAVLYASAPLRLMQGDIPRSALLKYISTFSPEFMATYAERSYADLDIGVDLCMPEPGTWLPRRPFHHWNGEYMYNLTHKQLEVESFTLKRYCTGITFALPNELGAFGGFSVACDEMAIGEFWDVMRGNHADIVLCIQMFHQRYQQLLLRKDTALIADWGLDEALASDWRAFQFGDVRFEFGTHQAKVVQLLFDARVHGKPWVSGKILKHKVGFISARLVDLFKSKPHWRRLILSDRRGNYCLNLNPAHTGS